MYKYSKKNTLFCFVRTIRLLCGSACTPLIQQRKLFFQKYISPESIRIKNMY